MIITINIPDAIATRVVNGVAYQHGYADTIINEQGEEIDNPETKAVYAKRMVIQNIKNAVRAYEATQAAETARQLAISAVNDEITIT